MGLPGYDFRKVEIINVGILRLVSSSISIQLLQKNLSMDQLFPVSWM
jgi:hypothetical protein